MKNKLYIIEGNSVPPIMLDLRKNNQKLQPEAGTYHIELKIVYPDGTIEYKDIDFDVIKQPPVFTFKHKDN